MNNKHIIPLITASTHLPRAGIAITPEIEQHIEQGAVIAFSISGGKDGTAAVLSTEAELRRRGHASQRVLIHSHLGQIEHGDALASCQRLATMTGLELIVIDAPGGGMIPAWRRRWQRNVQRYIESTFSFQEKRWLADVASHLLNDSDREQLERAKDKAAERQRPRAA